MPYSLGEIQADLRILKNGLSTAGVPTRLLGAIETRALRSGRRQTGEFQSNRQSRWNLLTRDPQFGTELDCKVILAKLLSQIIEFDGAPNVSPETIGIAAKYLAHEPTKASYRDPLTKEKLSYEQMEIESGDPRHGISSFHLGHEDPTAIPRHTPANVNWRSARSNLIQGDLTLSAARTKFVELIARYFGLGEVRIEPEDH